MFSKKLKIDGVLHDIDIIPCNTQFIIIDGIFFCKSLSSPLVSKLANSLPLGSIIKVFEKNIPTSKLDFYLLVKSDPFLSNINLESIEHLTSDSILIEIRKTIEPVLIDSNLFNDVLNNKKTDICTNTDFFTIIDFKNNDTFFLNCDLSSSIFPDSTFKDENPDLIIPSGTKFSLSDNLVFNDDYSFDISLFVNLNIPLVKS
jgi:hypothetical protein